ncbi:hypothetical protein BJF79_04930 [Actinomadura sp. CNU-125]|uniref:TetR family transcriptional regulator n=1 Tax=Actinomadura sp. CNU-125 TaxID=1904961 RepID=UPI000968BE4B|nr:TetR family transcriptional regulator [Actinomadura sp. CNU-125]OLT10074.1 hypothetical protein BJF79_04930 [Actinomadura sp. CNU-125]
MRAELAELALGLFVERGYEETKVEDVAAAAGLSKRSFFRYFPSKEDVVFGDVEDLADEIAGAVRARPADEPPWTVLRTVLGEWEERIHDAQRDPAVLRLIEATPALRARLHQRRDEMRARVGAALRERPGADVDAFTADLLTGCAAAGAGRRGPRVAPPRRRGRPARAGRPRPSRRWPRPPDRTGGTVSPSRRRRRA